MKRLVKLLIILIILYIPYVQALEFNITSDYVIMYNMNDDKVLYELESDKETQIASLTKIMTTIVAIEHTKDFNKEVVISKDVFNGIDDYTVVGFKVGDKATIKDLLYGTMLPSGADAVNALAIEVGGSISKFVDLMNEMAVKLELKHTHFDNPIGMDSDKNYSSASDIAKLLKYSLKNQLFKEIFTARTYKIESIGKTVSSTLIGYSRSYGLDITDITGAKSGYTDGAGLCLASTASIDDVEYLLVTMHADIKNRSNAVRDSLEIYDYYSSNYGYQKIISKEQKFKSIPVKWGKVESYDIVSDKDISVYLSNDIRKNRIKYVYEGVDELTYKNKKGEKLGIVKAVYDDDVLVEYSVYLNKDIAYYHPVLYAVIIIAIVMMLLSLEAMNHKRKKKKKRKK